MMTGGDGDNNQAVMVIDNGDDGGDGGSGDSNQVIMMTGGGGDNNQAVMVIDNGDDGGGGGSGDSNQVMMVTDISEEDMMVVVDMMVRGHELLFMGRGNSDNDGGDDRAGTS
jgi:hypothetical protein